MNRIWLALGLLAALITLCTATLVTTHTMTDDLKKEIETLRLAQEDDESVPDELERLEKTWKRYERAMSLYTRHSELEEINRVVTLLGGYWQEGQYDLYRVTCDEVLVAVEHLWETSKPSLRNIM